MTTAKPGKGPDTIDGRVALLGMLLLAKGELDAAMREPGQCVLLTLVEIEGFRTMIRGVATGPHGSKVKAAPKTDPTLLALSDLWQIAYLMLGYQGFDDRGWLAARFREGTVLTGKSALPKLEGASLVTISKQELQQWLRGAIRAVCAAAQAPHRRRTRVLEDDVKSILDAMADRIPKPLKHRGSKSTQPYRNVAKSRQDWGLGSGGKGASLGTPLRNIPGDRMRSALNHCQKEGYLTSTGNARARKWEMTAKGWEIANRSIGAARLQAMLMAGPVQLSSVTRILAGHGDPLDKPD